LASSDFSFPVVADFDGDSNADFVVAAGTSFKAYMGDGRGGFKPVGASLLNLWRGGGADFNGDGLADIFALQNSSGNAMPNALAVELNTTPGFSIRISSPTQVVHAGTAANYRINVGQQNGFTETVTLTCSTPAPASTSCTISPASVNPGSNAILTVSTTGNSAAWHASRALVRFYYAFCLPLFGIVSAAFGSSRRISRTMAGAIMTCLLLAGLMMQSACGGGASGASNNLGTLPGSYSITVVGASGTLQHSATTELTVK
jgi:hypothetical protein